MNIKTNTPTVAIEIKKANAQSLTCFIAFIATAALAAIIMIAAFLIPTIVTVTEGTCWLAMALEAASIGLGFASYWIKNHAL